MNRQMDIGTGRLGDDDTLNRASSTMTTLLSHSIQSESWKDLICLPAPPLSPLCAFPSFKVLKFETLSSCPRQSFSNLTLFSHDNHCTGERIRIVQIKRAWQSRRVKRSANHQQAGLPKSNKLPASAPGACPSPESCGETAGEMNLMMVTSLPGINRAFH